MMTRFGGGIPEDQVDIRVEQIGGPKEDLGVAVQFVLKVTISPSFKINVL